MIVKSKSKVAGYIVSGLLLNSVGVYALAASLGYVGVPEPVSRAYAEARSYGEAAIRDIAGGPVVHEGGEADPVSGNEALDVTDIAASSGEDPAAAPAVDATGSVATEAVPATGSIHIPTAQPRPRETKTFAEEVTTDGEAPAEAKAEIVAGYVLGEQGVSDEMRTAWSVLERATKDKPDPGRAEDPAVFDRAAGEIGYVPTGIRPETIRRLDAEIGSAGHEVVVGHMTVISADSGMVDGVEIRLQGILAPAAEDTCVTASGSSYDCAAWSTSGLETIIAGRDLSCEVTDVEHGADGARIGWCSLVMKNGSERDLGEIAVGAGLVSIADFGGLISPYLRAEQRAKYEKNGIWSGVYTPATE